MRDADARVANVDAHVLARTAAANENSAFGLGIFDGVADQISKDTDFLLCPLDLLTA
jgi:hypothetical protein